jgi:prepilin-type N-terminal cleavage/methylation domain-containing protein
MIDRHQQGMTLLEMLVAMSMLVVFTGVVALVMEFTFRFLGAAESGETNEFDVSNGVLIDHQEIQLEMDRLVELLSQPGISRDRLDGALEGTTQIAFDPDVVEPEVACVPGDPVQKWNLPMPAVVIPPGYRFCLWKTTERESPMGDLLAGAPGAKPGIYLLQALPERLSATTLPTRRLFCRPRPFC